MNIEQKDGLTMQIWRSASTTTSALGVMRLQFLPEITSAFSPRVHLMLPG
jgi:hypothetical protein